MSETVRSIKETAQKILFDMSCWLEQQSQKAEAENRLASVSSWKFVRCFEPVAKEICEWSTKQYCDLCEEARERLLSGEEVADVLRFFDVKLEYVKRQAQPPQEG